MPVPGGGQPHLLERDERLVTTSYVLVETFALVQNRLGMEAVRVLADDAGPSLHSFDPAARVVDDLASQPHRVPGRPLPEDARGDAVRQAVRIAGGT